MGRTALTAYHAGHVRSDWPEDLRVHPRAIDAPRVQNRLNVRQIARRSAEIEIRVSRDAELLQERPGHVALPVVIEAEAINGTRATIDVAVMAVAERREQPARLTRKRVMGRVARRVDPPDVTCRTAVARRRMEHAKERRHADTGAEQNDGGRTRC